MTTRLLLCQAALIIFATLRIEAETITHAGTEFWIRRMDPNAETLELHLAERRGEPNTFPKLEARLQAKGRRLLFAMNSGIFEGNFLPTGLHIYGDISYLYLRGQTGPIEETNWFAGILAITEVAP